MKKLNIDKVKTFLKKYKIQSIVVGFIFLVGVVMLIGRSFADPGSGYLKNRVVDNLSFENASLVYESGVTTFTVEVYNESGKVYNLKNVSINLADADGKVTTLIGYIGETLEKDEGKIITASIDKDLSSSTNLEYIVNK